MTNEAPCAAARFTRNAKCRRIAASAPSILAMLFVGDTAAIAATTESRDPVRGVTFYSTEISTDKKSDLQMISGLFSSSDVMTFGISAFFFDESESVDEYVVWMRHDGPRRWFMGQIDQPLEIHVGDADIRPAPFHQSRFDETVEPSLFVEKLEFALSPAEFDSIVSSDEVVFEVRTLLGTVIKDLSDDEIATIRRFAAEAHERHHAIRAAQESQAGGT